MPCSSLTILIPVYNSAQCLESLVARLEPVLQEIGVPAELLLVNDASRDNSWQVIESLARRHDWIKGICLMRNFGQHNALLCGIREASGEIIVTIDDDLQHPPEEIPKVLARLEEGYDVVYGTPAHEKHSFLRALASKTTKLALQEAMGAETATKISAFRGFRSAVAAVIKDYRGPSVNIDVLLSWATTSFTAIAVRHEPRTIGTSNYTIRKLLTHAFNMITGFSVIPLQAASMLGFACAMFGFMVLVYVVGRYFIHGASVPGFAFLASIITIFSGAQLLSIGIIGEYLARMHFRIMDRIPFAVRAVTPPNQRGEKHDP